MLYAVYSIRDAKTGFMAPLVDVNDEAAKRNFYHSVINADSVLRSFAPDFDLYQVATFDSDSGRMEPLTVPMYIASATDAYNAMRGEDSK